MALPEFLLGTPYENYDHEGTLVMAYSMALLQELNGRNVNNPIASLRGEVVFPIAGTRRADLHLDLDAMNILSPKLGRYGIKKHGWLEAKFFKTNDSGAPTYDKLKSTLYIARDLIKLSIFPPETNLPSSTSSRYFLHVYKGNPNIHLARRKNKSKNADGFIRSWTDGIRKVGVQKLNTFRFDREVTQFDTIIGKGLRHLQLELTVTNYSYEPVEPNDDDYWMYLTRLDKIKIEHGSDWFEIGTTNIKESASGVYEKIGRFTAESLLSGNKV